MLEGFEDKWDKNYFKTTTCIFTIHLYAYVYLILRILTKISMANRLVLNILQLNLFRQKIKTRF